MEKPQVSNTRNMSRNEIAVSFADLVDQAEGLNRTNRDRRWFPIQVVRGGRLLEFGMYDGRRKRYVLSSINDREANSRLVEIRNMLRD